MNETTDTEFKVLLRQWGMFNFSSRESLIASMCRYGKPVYGDGTLIWYYTVDINVPNQMNMSTDRRCTIKFFTGDMNHGETSLMIKWEDLLERPMRPEEEASPLLKWLVTKYVK